MKTYRVAKNLWLHEYIPEELYKKFCDKKPHYLIGLIDRRLILVDQFLRERFGPVIINNWHIGGDREWSGIRVDGGEDYSFFSQHSYGRASDKLFMGVTSDEVREDIKLNYTSMYRQLGLTCIEAGVGWVHSDVRTLLRSNELLIVNPK